MELTEFINARLDEMAAPSWRLVPYACSPGHCAPAGWVGSRCHICQDGTQYGGTVEAITAMCEEHADHIHQRWLVLRAVEAHRKIVALHALVPDEFADEYYRGACRRCDTSGPEAQGYPCDTLRALASIWADHDDYDPAWA